MISSRHFYTSGAVVLPLMNSCFNTCEGYSDLPSHRKTMWVLRWFVLFLFMTRTPSDLRILMTRSWLQPIFRYTFMANVCLLKQSFFENPFVLLSISHTVLQRITVLVCDLYITFIELIKKCRPTFLRFIYIFFACLCLSCCTPKHSWYLVEIS